MKQITVTVPDAFVPVLNEFLQVSQAGTAEQWLEHMVRGVLFDFTMRKEFGGQQYDRARQLNTFWPGPLPQPFSQQPPFPPRP